MRRIITLLFLAYSLDSSAAVSNWIPFDSDGGHISIPVTLNGVETRAILDSGASGNGISEKFLEKHDGEYSHGKRIILQGISGTREVRLVNGIDIVMFGTNFKIDKLMPVRIYSADLLVGLSFFNNFILQIDYPNSQLRIITHDALNLRKSGNVRMKKSSGSRQPIVKVNMNNEADLWLTLDTGNSTGLLIPRRSASRFNWMDKYGTVTSQVRGVTKVANVERFNIPEVTIGPFTLENVIVIVPSEGEKTNVGRASRAKTGSRLRDTDSDGILGYDILRHFIVTIDFKHSRLHLQPPPES